MKTSAKAAFVILLVGLPWAWSQSVPSPHIQPTVSEIAATFTNFDRITTNVVYVDGGLAMLCRGMTKEDIEAAHARYGPHFNTGIQVYMNKLATGAFATNSGAYPVGAVIVKQKKILGYTDEAGKQVREADKGVGGMVKRAAGYDPTHGDWEYFYFEDAAKIESGRISTCVQCHSSAKEKDYVFGTWRETGR